MAAPPAGPVFRDVKRHDVNAMLVWVPIASVVLVAETQRLSEGIGYFMTLSAVLMLLNKICTQTRRKRAAVAHVSLRRFLCFGIILVLLEATLYTMIGLVWFYAAQKICSNNIILSVSVGETVYLLSIFAVGRWPTSIKGATMFVGWSALAISTVLLHHGGMTKFSLCYVVVLTLSCHSYFLTF